MNAERLTIPIDEGLTLRQYAPQEAEVIYALMLANRAQLVTFAKELPGFYPTAEHLRKSITNPGNPDRKRFGIWNEQDVLVGSINFEPYQETNSVEIDFFVGRNFQGRGIATRAIKSVVNFLSTQPGLETIVAIADVTNTASLKILEYNDFRERRTMESQKGTYIEFVRPIKTEY